MAPGSEAMDGAMRPPPVPQKTKRGQVAPPADEPAPKRIELGDDLPDEVSREDIQQMLDKADELHVETLTETSLKRMHLQFERKVKVNRELRIKHGDDPDKFLKSEVDLDEEIKKFTLVATHPELYGALLKLETLPLLVGMLNHVNTDIAVDVFEVLSELTDPEVLSEVEDPEGFVKAIFDAQLCQMTVDVLMRIDETVSDEDFKAVTNGLSLIENLADLMPQETCRQFLEIANFLPWLIKRLRAQGMDYNKVYASEILGIVLQNSEQAREEMVKLEGVDKLLRGIAAYRKRDPADSEEAEYVQNMFDCICSLMLLKTNQIAFGNLQGLELMIRMMKEKVFAATLALKLVDHSLRHCPENCQIFVEKLGLKVLFAIFMKKGAKTKKQSEAKEVEEHAQSPMTRYTTWPCPRSGMLQPWQPFMAFAVLLSIALEGCDESAQTCYPDDSASDTGQYSCVNNKYCSRQNFAEILPEAMSLQECMNECVSRNCQVIQYDCGTHCWLLDSCGDHVESGCGSSVYYRDLNFVAATTTTTTTTTTVSLIGSCFPDTVDSGEYSCSANKLCSQQLAASKVFSSLSLDLCLDQCNQDPTCHSIQHECGSQCWLMNNGATCGTESACFPSTVNTGTYTCVADSYCMNQERATKYTSVTSLSDCLDVCNNLDACTAVQWDCGTECWAMVDDTCGTEIQSLCGSSLYYKVTTTTTTTTTQAATTLAGPDNCWPGVEPNGLFTCHAQKYCSNQLDAKNLGAMTLQACMRECEQYQCGAIQYDCNEECWLLRSCESYVDSSCESQTYVSVADGWPATTTTTTIFGACFPTSDISYTFTDFTCTPAVYCNTQASASKYGSMTIHQCAEMCRHDSTCSYIQYDCNTDCWLLASCDTYLTSTCGSSIYQKSTSSNSAGSTYLLADGHTSITYSPTSCSEDDCVVTASCPAGSWPTECSTIPPQSGDGAYQGNLGNRWWRCPCYQLLKHYMRS
eukprot:symbB.v1.2.006556.t1/scaffold391.1/size216359/11